MFKILTTALAVAGLMAQGLFAGSYYDEYDSFGRKRVPDCYQNQYRRRPCRREPPPPPRCGYYNGCYGVPGDTVVLETGCDEYTKYQVRENGTLRKKNKMKVLHKKNGGTVKIHQKMPKRIKVRPRRGRFPR